MPNAVIVAHGAPADPPPQEARLQQLAQQVTGHLPAGWCVRGATLAAPGAFEAALADLQAPLIYPLFMATGWFTGVALPRRLAAAGMAGAHRLAPLGTDPALPALMAQKALAAAGGRPETRALLIAAHGSKVSRSSADTTHEMVARLKRQTPFGRVVAGFVEEAPFLAEAARGLGPAICLPFFALRAGHVIEDLPQALEQAAFDGPLMPPIGEAPEIPALIAAALLRGQSEQEVIGRPG